MLVVLAVVLDTNDVVAEAGDAMDVNVILKRSSKGASENSGRNRDSEFVWSDRERSNVAGNRGTTTWDSRKVRGKAEAKEGTRDSSSVVTSWASLVWV